VIYSSGRIMKAQKWRSAMKCALMVFPLLVASAFAAPYIGTDARSVGVDVQPTYESQFYWDDGELSRAWCWLSGGNYWAVQFDEEKTDGIDRGIVEALGTVVYPNWPDLVFQGAYLHIFDDDGGVPGASIFHEFFMFTIGNEFEWFAMEQHVYGSVFYVAFEQPGDYPLCDALGVDADAGTHNWTCYQGSWDNTAMFSDFMLRCYWQPLSGVASSTWGRIKSLY
jgi:hypothetical protein